MDIARSLVFYYKRNKRAFSHVPGLATGPNSASQLQRKLQLAKSPTKHIAPLLLRCMQRVVRAVLAQLTVKQLQVFNIDSPFGSLAQFSGVK